MPNASANVSSMMVPSICKRLTSPPQRPFDFALAVGLFHRFAFVVQLFTAAQADLHLRQTTGVEINSLRHKRQPLFVGLGGELLLLFTIEQQLSRPLRHVVPE